MSTVTISAGAFGRGTGGRGAVRRRAVGQRAVGQRAGGQRAVRPAVRPGSAVADAAGGLSGRRAPVRLTRRGRLVVTFLLLVAFLAGGIVLAGDLATAGTEPGAAATATRVTVQPGETLWSIAERVAPGTDPRDTVEDILRLNHLDSVAVDAGSVLLLP